MSTLVRGKKINDKSKENILYTEIGWNIYETSDFPTDFFSENT